LSKHVFLCAHAEIAETRSEHVKRIVKKLEATRVRDHRSDTTCGQSFDHHRSGGAAAEGRCPACINQWRLSAMVQILSKYASKVISDVHGHFLEKCLPIILLLSDNVSAISACVRKYAEAMF